MSNQIMTYCCFKSAALAAPSNKEYKRITSLWNVKRRNIIEDSLALIKADNSPLSVNLEATLKSTPVVKPEAHAGGEESDYFKVYLSEEEMQELVDTLFMLEAEAVPQNEGVGFEKEAMQAREANRIASLVDEWNKINAD